MLVWAPVLGGLGFLQGVALLLLGAGWAGAYDVSRGDCGYDGSCSDAHSLTVSALGWLVLVAVEGGMGALSAWAAWRARRAADGGADFPELLAFRGAVAVMVGCAASWLLVVQASVVSHVAADRHPASDTLQGRFFMTWNTRAMVVEGLAALVGWMAIGWLRRVRAQPPARPAA